VGSRLFLAVADVCGALDLLDQVILYTAFILTDTECRAMTVPHWEEIVLSQNLWQSPHSCSELCQQSPQAQPPPTSELANIVRQCPTANQ
jgi:hypothetical protein